MRDFRLLAVVLVAFLIAFEVSVASPGSTVSTASGVQPMQPSLSLTFFPQADTWVEEEAPTATHGAGEELSVGRYSNLAGSFTQQTLIWFDLVALPPGATILTATLKLYQSQVAGATPYSVLPEAIEGRWDESNSNWLFRPSSTVTDGPVALDAKIGWQSLDITNMAAGWASGQILNYGVLLRGAGATVGVREFGARELVDRSPRLVIEYALPAQCSEFLSPTGIPSPSLIDFDDLANFAVIGTAYKATYGVTFENSATTRGTIYGVGSRGARSPPNVAYNDAVAPNSSVNVPLRVFFDTNMTHAGFWIGNGETYSPTATLTAYDDSESAICSVQNSPVPEPHTAFIGIHDPYGRIASLGLDYGATTLSESIDDLYFAREAAEAIPPGISNIRPSGWVTSTRTPSVYADVIDAGSGIGVASASYRYSRDGGSTWSVYQPARATGSNGVTSTQIMTATSVPFNADSATQNLIEFRIVDMVGNVGTAGMTITVDITPPTAPVTLTSSSHTVAEWSSDDTIDVSWGGAADATSGVSGYSVSFDHNPGGIPDETIETSATSYTSPALIEGYNWYTHVRVRDAAGFWSASTRHAGPFRVDATPPDSPTVVSSSSHTPSDWSNDSTIAMIWAGASDGGSGVAGYSYAWTTLPGSIPDAVIDTVFTSEDSPPLSDGNSWYFHIRTRDAIGNWSNSVVHVGPYYIDTVAPTSVASSPASTGRTSFVVGLSGSDLRSGIASYDVQSRDVTSRSGWTNFMMGTASSSLRFEGLNGHIYQFRARARDNVGNVGAFPNSYDSQTNVDNINIWVRNPGLEVNQAVQDLDNSVTLIAGKRTFVRAYVRSDVALLPGVPARLTVYRGDRYMGQLTPSNAGGTITVRNNADRSNLDHSYYFDVPTAWLEAGSVTFQFGVNTPQRYAESDYSEDSNARWTTVDFVRSPAMNLMIVNLPYMDNGVVRNIRQVDRTNLASWLRRAFPISTLNARRTSFVTPYASLPDAETVNADLASVQARAILDGADPWTRYYGMAIDTGGFMRGLAVDIPSTIASGPTGRPAVYTDWDTDDSYGDWYGGHELGHTYGRAHVTGAPPAGSGKCGDEEGAGFYPYDNGDISPTRTEWSRNALYGFDASGPIVIPPSWKDVMTYCRNEWVSDFTYEGIFGRMSAEQPVAVAEVRALAAAGGEHLAVFGTIITPTDHITLTAVYRVAEGFDVFSRNTVGEYHIVLFDISNIQLADYRFSPRFNPAAEEPVGLITELVPWVTDTRKVSIVHNSSVLTSRNVSANSPSVTLVYPNGGEILSGGSVTVTWTASDADGDALTYSLDYSRDSGATWTPIPATFTATQIALDLNELAGTVHGRFRIWANDGVNSAGDSSNADFTVAGKTPSITQILPNSGRTYVVSQTVTFEGQAYDVEDGQLADSRLVWSSSLRGSIGAGQVLGISDLVTGTHVITLTATDSDNSSTQATTIVVVTEEPPTSGTTYQIFLPGVFRTY